jgi:hypothetical protein
MVTIIKKGQEIESIKDALKKVVPKKKNNDILKFAGTLKINIICRLQYSSIFS